MEDDVFSFSKINDIIFVFAHDDMKKSKLKTISTAICSKFFELYNLDFKNWNNDVSQFDNFEEEVDKIIAPKSTILEMESFLQNQKKKRLEQKKL